MFRSMIIATKITRLALAFAVATLACLSPLAHADEPGVEPVRHYVYEDKDGSGTMTVQDGLTHPNGKSIYNCIYVTSSQNCCAYSGKGWRTLVSKKTDWLVNCEFWVYGNGLSAKFTGYLPIKGAGAGSGSYYLNGSGAPYSWECYLD